MVARDVLDSLIEGCQVIGFDWTYLYVNDAVARQAGQPKEALLGRTMMQCFPGIDQTPMFADLRRCMTTRSHHRMENEFTFPDGSVGWFELQFVPVPQGTCILSVDLTAKKRAEAALSRTTEQLRHAQKMEAIGLLAGSVAHDFNNVLSVVLSYAALALDSLPADEPTREDISEIHKAGLQARDLTTQLLAISRQQASTPRIVNLNDSLVSMENMLRRVLGANVTLQIVVSPTLGHVRMDPGHVEQIILNLAINARDAMPLGGTLTLETGSVEFDDTYVREHLGTSTGPHVMLAVSDSGTGMDAATQARIFEPFFTTKPPGKGTGLGLSTIFGIVKQSGGSIWVYSETGKGTTFKLYFPRVHEAPNDADPLPSPASLRRSGHETILVVEDDAQLRRLATGILDRNGYTVLGAGNPDEALEASRQYTGHINLLLTDITMPGMTGPELAARLRESRPGMKVLFMSGYTGDAIKHHGFSDTDALICKPITPDGLSRALQAALDSPTRTDT